MDLEEQLSRLDLSTYPIKEIEKIVEGLYKLGLSRHIIPVGSTFQRCSHISVGEMDNLVSRLSYNPRPEKFGRANVSCLEKYGRADLNNAPMFYGCYDKPNRGKTLKEMYACTLEVRAQLYSSVIYSKWLVNQPLKVGCIVHPSIYPNSRNRFLEEIKQNYAIHIKRNKEFGLDNVWGQVCALFSKEFPNNNDYNYLFTALLTKKLIEVSHYDGILYPSVQTAGELCMNLALTKKAVDNKISFMSAQKSKVSYEYNYLKTTPLQIGKTDDGKNLIWSDAKGQ